MKVNKKEFEIAETKMNGILAIVTQKGGFEFLSKSEKLELEKHTQTVKEYEVLHYNIPLPETLKGILELKMYERKLKQKDMAKMLHTTDTKLSEIMNSKRKPSLAFIKQVHQTFNIDGNLLLKIAL